MLWFPGKTIPWLVCCSEEVNLPVVDHWWWPYIFLAQCFASTEVAHSLFSCITYHDFALRIKNCNAFFITLRVWLGWWCSLKTNWMKQPISLFIMWTTIMLVKSTNNLVFLTNFIVQHILSLVHLTQSLLHLNHNSVSLTNIMVIHIMNNIIGCFN